VTGARLGRGEADQPPPCACTSQGLGDAAPDLKTEVLAMLAAVFDAVPGGGGGDNSGGDGTGRGPSWDVLLVGCDIFGALLAALLGPTEEDALLEAAALAGTLAGHAAIAPQLAESGAVSKQGGRW
jgi:hypothetical protein